MKTAHSQAVSFRLDQDLQRPIKAWLSKHPSLNLSRLSNMALRHFVTTEQRLDPVETIIASDTEVVASLKKMMKKHKKTLDQLK